MYLVSFNVLNSTWKPSDSDKMQTRHSHEVRSIQTYIHTYIHTDVHTYRRTYVQTYIRTYTHTCIHSYLHTCKHACMHTYMRKSHRVIEPATQAISQAQCKIGHAHKTNTHSAKGHTGHRTNHTSYFPHTVRDPQRLWHKHTPCKGPHQATGHQSTHSAKYLAQANKAHTVQSTPHRPPKHIQSANKPHRPLKHAQCKIGHTGRQSTQSAK